MAIKKTWRNDPGLICETEYKKRFAWFPILCKGESKRIWLKTYYKQYMNWGHSFLNIKKGYYDSMFHQDFQDNITEEEYLVRKIADTL